MSSGCWKIHGPFGLDKHIDKSWEQLFRDQTRNYDGLADATGVYIITSTLRRKTRIRYVGMTHRQGFAKETFSQRNRDFIWSHLYDERNSQVRIWLVAKKTASGKSYAWQARMENESYLLETLFIMHAKAAGHKLLNTAKMKSADGIAVEGLFGKRQRGRASQGLIEISQLLSLAPAP